MGAGIAEVCARAGLDVIIQDVDKTLVERGRQRVESSLSQALARRKISERDMQDATRRITYTVHLGDLASCDLAIEAVTEDEAAKLEVFQALDKIVERPDALLASNTSSIPIMKLGAATRRPEQVLGLHFINPVPVMPLVELVTCLLTGQETITRAENFVLHVLGKQVIRSQDRAGFIINALLVPYLLSAIRMVESGFTTIADVDTAMELGCAHPMGPLRLADLIGLDTVAAIAFSLYDEFKEARYSPPPQLLRMVDAGMLGRKSGQGFHRYDQATA